MCVKRKKYEPNPLQFPIHVDADFVRFGHEGPTISMSALKNQSLTPDHLDLMVNGWHRFAADTNLAAAHPLLPMKFRPNEGLFIKTATPWFQGNEHASFEVQLLSAWEAALGRELRIKPGDHLLLARSGVPLKVLVRALV